MLQNGLYLGDSNELIKQIEDNSVDLIVTDPPYFVKKAKHTNSKTNRIEREMKRAMTDLVDSDIDEGYKIETFGKEFLRIQKDLNLYIWCNKAQIPAYFDFYVQKNKCKFDILFWVKSNAMPTYYNKYLTDTEYLLYFHKGKGHTFPQSYEDAQTCFIAPINSTDKKKYGHPTIKPMEITEKIIRNSSREGEIVLDCFMGSGTTGVACKHLNRQFIGMEKSEEYFNIAQKRIEEE